jgi:hypothetical protein
MFTTLIRTIFGGASAPVDDPAIPVGHRGNVPVYIGGVKEGIERLKLRPIVIRSTRHRQPHPVEQGAIGLKADRDFAPPPGGPLVKPTAARGIAAAENGSPPDRRPYAPEPDELGATPADQARAERASSTMWVEPYGLSGRQLSQ